MLTVKEPTQLAPHPLPVSRGPWVGVLTAPQPTLLRAHILGPSAGLSTLHRGRERGDDYLDSPIYTMYDSLPVLINMCRTIKYFSSDVTSIRVTCAMHMLQ